MFSLLQPSFYCVDLLIATTNMPSSHLEGSHTTDCCPGRSLRTLTIGWFLFAFRTAASGLPNCSQPPPVTLHLPSNRCPLPSNSGQLPCNSVGQQRWSPSNSQAGVDGHEHFFFLLETALLLTFVMSKDRPVLPLSLFSFKVHFANGDILHLDGSLTNGKTGQVLPPGAQIAADGSARLANGMVVKPDGSVQLPNGAVKLPDGRVRLADGGWAMADEDGNVPMPDGTILYKNGEVRLPDETILRPDGHCVMSDGTIRLRDGTVKPKDFQLPHLQVIWCAIGAAGDGSDAPGYIPDTLHPAVLLLVVNPCSHSPVRPCVEIRPPPLCVQRMPCPTVCPTLPFGRTVIFLGPDSLGTGFRCQTACPTNTPVRTVFFEGFIVRWTAGGGVLPHPAQPVHTNHWAPRTRKRHQQEHRPQRPTESSDPTQQAKGRTGDCPGPRKGTTTQRNVTQGGGGIRFSLLMHGVLESIRIAGDYLCIDSRVTETRRPFFCRCQDSRQAGGCPPPPTSPRRRRQRPADHPTLAQSRP